MKNSIDPSWSGIREGCEKALDRIVGVFGIWIVQRYPEQPNSIQNRLAADGGMGNPAGRLVVREVDQPGGDREEDWPERDQYAGKDDSGDGVDPTIPSHIRSMDERVDVEDEGDDRENRGHAYSQPSEDPPRVLGVPAGSEIPRCARQSADDHYAVAAPETQNPVSASRSYRDRPAPVLILASS